MSDEVSTTNYTEHQKKQDPNKNPWDTFRAMYKRMDELENEIK